MSFNISVENGKSKRLLTGGKYCPDDILVTAEEPKPVPEKKVNFYDCDGTLLYSYTPEEVQGLTELPPLPSQKGLVCQGWNWTLEDVQAYVREYGVCDIGATYITDDGKTRLYITIAAEGRMTVPLYFTQTVANGVTIDWGDGSQTETLSGSGVVNTSHTYASIGSYVITLAVAEECGMQLGTSISGYCLMGEINATSISGRPYLRKVEIGAGVNAIASYALQSCYALESITIPQNVAYINGMTFHESYSLRNVIIPNGAVLLAGSAFSKCTSLTNVVAPPSAVIWGAFSNCSRIAKIVLHDKTTAIRQGVLAHCYSLTSIIVPKSVTSIEGSAFTCCYSMAFYDFTHHTAVPTLANINAFTNIPADCEIRVPAALYDEWIAATNWATYADHIVGV